MAKHILLYIIAAAAGQRLLQPQQFTRVLCCVGHLADGLTDGETPGDGVTGGQHRQLHLRPPHLGLHRLQLGQILGAIVVLVRTCRAF